MFNIGTGEMIMIAVVALLVLGPQRLPELARGIGKFIREFRRQTDDVRNVVEREFYRMDQEVMKEAPQVQAPADAVPVHPALPVQPLPEQVQPEAPAEPQQGELALQPPPVDESEPGHPDYNREEKPPEEPAAPAAPDAPTQKAG
jgi:sec-independent protein translocase protein TatB